MNKVILLMTASVSTRGMRGGCFSNEECESMYVATLLIILNIFLKKTNSVKSFLQKTQEEILKT